MVKTPSKVLFTIPGLSFPLC